VSAIDAAAQRIRSWRSNVAQFAWDNFKFKPDRWQQEFFDVFPSQDANKKRIALQACAGPGKTAVLAIGGLNALSCYGRKNEHPKGAAVSVTGDNLKDNLWPEFAVWMDRSEYLKSAFVWTKKRIHSRQHPETWFISARSWSKSATPEEQGRTLSGLHSRFVIVLIDESGDIPPSVLRSAEQSMGNAEWCKIVQAGNPTSHTGMLYEAATKLADQWYPISITGDPDDANRSPRVDIEWARQQIKEHGRDNPWVMSFILGKFPPQSINSLLGPDEVDLAMARRLSPEAFSWSQKRLGVDCARFGDDRTVIYPRQGLFVGQPIEMRNARGHEIAARVAAAKMKWGSEMEFVDDTGGWGAGTVDALSLANITAMPINFSAKATDPHYFNKRSEMHWMLAQAVKGGLWLPRRPGLKKELTTPVYWFEGGKIRIEEKEQIKKRLKMSPDEADALALTYAFPDMPGEMQDAASVAMRALEGRGNSTVGGGVHDPYAGN
jgi:hypothetical protein